MQIITIAIRNGGTAKTNTAQHLAIGLRDLNKKVLLIDLDTQLNLTDNVNANKDHANIYDVLQGNCTIKNAIQHLKDVDIITASNNLSVFQLNDAKKVYLRPVLEQLKNDYDFIIIDTSPSIDVLTLSALKSCDKVLIPIQTDKKSISGIMQIANELRALNIDTSVICGILLTRVKRNQNGTKLVISYLENLASMLNTTLFKSNIRECAQVRDAELNGSSVFEYAPKSNASLDYREFVKEFLERVEKWQIS